MRTLILIAVGLALATVLLRLAPSSQRLGALLVFAAVWLGACAWNLSTGLSHGYTLAEELPIHAVLFSVPMIWAWFWYRRLPV